MAEEGGEEAGEFEAVAYGDCLLEVGAGGEGGGFVFEAEVAEGVDYGIEGGGD